MLHEGPWARILYPLLASIAGAITALSFRPYKAMSNFEIGLSLFVGASFAMFVGPWVAFMVFGNGPADMRMMGALFYVMASGSNVLIPLAVRWLSRSFGMKSEDGQ